MPEQKKFEIDKNSIRIMRLMDGSEVIGLFVHDDEVAKQNGTVALMYPFQLMREPVYSEDDMSVDGYTSIVAPFSPALYTGNPIHITPHSIVAMFTIEEQFANRYFEMVTRMIAGRNEQSNSDEVNKAILEEFDIDDSIPVQ